MTHTGRLPATSDNEIGEIGPSPAGKLRTGSRTRSIALAALALGLAAPLVLTALQLPQGLNESQPLPLPRNTQSHPGRSQEVQFIPPGQILIEAHHPERVDLHFLVANGLHINSHAPRDKTLIATRLAVIEGNGIKVTAVDFPPGADFAPAFSPREKLSVYSGDLVLQAHLIATPGEHRLTAELHYQACDINACMPPRILPIALNVIAR